MQSGPWLRPKNDVPYALLKDGAVVVVAGSRHLALTPDAAWELLSSLEGALRQAQPE